MSVNTGSLETSIPCTKTKQSNHMPHVWCGNVFLSDRIPDHQQCLPLQLCVIARSLSFCTSITQTYLKVHMHTYISYPSIFYESKISEIKQLYIFNQQPANKLNPVRVIYTISQSSTLASIYIYNTDGTTYVCARCFKRN